MKLRHVTARRSRINVKLLAIGTVACLLLGVSIVRYTVGYWVRTNDDSMRPGLQPGEVRFVYADAQPGPGDIALVSGQQGRHPRRIIGLAGDRIRVSNGRAWVNDTLATGRWTNASDAPSNTGSRVYLERLKADENYRVILAKARAHHPSTTTTVTVPDGFAYLLCDNRPLCADDEMSGLIPVTRITGVIAPSHWP
ncbi:MAG: signal peptidase I [Myxococcota bacterium]|nr:signal peptidase I [Myxococcota bacterium]